MKLLYWGSVSPHDDSGIVALRFLKPLQISLIRVFAAGETPFDSSPDTVAETEPDAFYLNIFFNSIPGPNAGPVDKDKRNALTPTTIVYTGGNIDFPMDLGADYSTRLMILKGSFKTLSFSLYGEVVSHDTDSSHYEPISLPSVSPFPLSIAIDPANNADPTFLAKNLLSLVEDAPPLTLIIRLMFCLKPTDDDWDDPAFPYHGTDLTLPDEFDLSTACYLAGRPVGRTSEDAISTFVDRVSELIGARSLVQSDEIAKLLCASASQPPSLMRALCQKIDPEAVFDAAVVDDVVLLYILDAAANVQFARRCNSDAFSTIMNQCIESPTSDAATKIAAERILARLHAWTMLEGALESTDNDFPQLTNIVKDFGTEEKALGIWLESIILLDGFDGFAEHLAEYPVAGSARVMANSSDVRQQSDFVAYVRAFIGVASVFVVWAWSDSVGNDECRERTLIIIRLWQNVEGYREIVHHLLLLRQFSRRLKWIVERDEDDDDSPLKSGTIGEEIIAELGKEPQAMFHPDFRETILSLTPPMAFLSDSERTRLRKAAVVADEGLPSALEELFYQSGHPSFSLRRLYVLRVSLACVEREVAESQEGELRVIQTAWGQHSMGLTAQLISLLQRLSKDLSYSFNIVNYPPPRMDIELLEQLFYTTIDLFRVIKLLTNAIPITPRAVQDMTSTSVDVAASCSSAISVFSSSICICKAASATLQSCLDFVRRLSQSTLESSSNKPTAQIIMRAIFEFSMEYKGTNPVIRLKQAASLVENILPPVDAENSADWVASVLPPLLAPMKSFFRVIDAPEKVSLTRKLIYLDNGTIGVAEWLLIAELKGLLQVLESIRLNPSVDGPHALARKCAATATITFLAKLVAVESHWFGTLLTNTPDTHISLKDMLVAVLDGWFTSKHLTTLVRTLASLSKDHDLEDMTSSVGIAWLRMCSQETNGRVWDSEVLLHLLDKSRLTDAAALRLEIGRFLAAASQASPSDTTAIRIVVQWLRTQDDPAFRTLYGITSSQLSQLHDMLEDLGDGFSLDEDEIILPLPIDLDEPALLPLKDVPDLFRPENEPQLPSTPVGTVTPDVLGILVSPHKALLHSPLASTLTKTYTNNDFRDLRQIAARQNTSRLPSTHVDVGIPGRSA